jgi:hypothetical protein
MASGNRSSAEAPAKITDPPVGNRKLNQATQDQAPDSNGQSDGIQRQQRLSSQERLAPEGNDGTSSNNVPVREATINHVPEPLGIPCRSVDLIAETAPTPPVEKSGKNQQMILYNRVDSDRPGGMAWSPERISGRKRAGSPRGRGAHAASSARRLNPVQDLNSSPVDREEPFRSSNPSGLIDTFNPLVHNLSKDAQPMETGQGYPHPTNFDEGVSSPPSRSQVEVQALHPSYSHVMSSQHSSGQSNGASLQVLTNTSTDTSISEPAARGPLTPREARLVDRLDNSHSFQLQVRDVQEVAQGLEGTTLSALRLGQACPRLREERSIAEPYGSGVQITRREIDYRVPLDSYGARRLMIISESPERALPSDQSLPWPQ